MWPLPIMVSLARTVRIDAPPANVWANLNDLESFARGLPVLSNIHAESDQLLSRFDARVGLWSVAGSLAMRVTERMSPRRLRVQGTVSLDDDSPASHQHVRFDVAWFLEFDAVDATRVTYVMRVRATPMLERLASMAFSRRAGSLDRRVMRALAKPVAGRRAA